MSYTDGAIILAIVCFVEWVIKGLICKGNEKYKLLYTFAPIVLGAIVYAVIAFITKVPVIPELIKGATYGFSAMGVYDAIVKIAKDKGGQSLKELIEEVIKTMGK